MRAAVVCKNALLRDCLLSLLVNNGNFQVAGSGEFVNQGAAMISESGLLLVMAEGLEADDWITLGDLRSSGRVKVILITDSINLGSVFKASDMTVRCLDGGAGLLSAASRFASQRTEVPVKAGVKAIGDAGAVYTRAKRGLTARELDIALLVAQGMPNKAIAEKLGLVDQSVKNLVSSIMRKLQCDNRVQVALKLTGQPTASHE